MSMGRIIRVAVAFALLAASASAAFGGISLKVTGGMRYLFRNDYNLGVQGIYDFYRSNYGGASGQFNALRLGFSLGGEVALTFGKNLALGLGAGYGRYSRDSEFGYEWSFFSSDDTLKPRIQLVPLTLNVHYYTPLGTRLKSDLYAGVGYYWLAFDHEWRIKTNFFSYETTQTFKAKRGNLGFQGGIGLELELGPQVALVFQASGQIVKFTDIKGQWKETGRWFKGEWQEETSEAYFWFFQRRDSGNAFAQILFSATAPSEAEYSFIRKGQLDLSGISAAIGLKLIF